jgi:hypothetical protein
MSIAGSTASDGSGVGGDMTMLHKSASAVGFLLVLASCGPNETNCIIGECTGGAAGATTSTTGDGGAALCVPGQQIACACPGGSMGAQACLSDGSGYGACECAGVGGSGAGGSQTGGLGGGGHGGTAGSGGAGGQGGALPCNGALDTDDDGDGVSEEGGDCDDCNAMVNPGALEALNGEFFIDDDCNGVVDDVPLPCDGGLALDDADPYHGAAAIELCQVATGKAWGLLDAKYVRLNDSDVNLPSPLQHGVMPTFGVNVAARKGDRMLVLSTGHARTPSDPDACGFYSCTNNNQLANVAGYPLPSPGCPGPSVSIRDDVGIRLTVRVPTNVTGFAFDSRWFTFEYPEWTCTSFNDQFLALVDPPPNGVLGGNVLFDTTPRPMCVVSDFVEVCLGCLYGAADLAGTGFDAWDTAAAGTPWLTTTSPVVPGSETVFRFAAMDIGDSEWDSTALVDKFRWLTETSVNVTTVAVP